jgi:ribosome-associated heat shock protein Hsp15
MCYKRRMDAPESVRVDKWLWAVRLFKTRALAAAACDAGRVRVNGQPAKPARNVRVGDALVADNGSVIRTVKVRALIEKRIGAPRVAEFLEDLTLPEPLNRPAGPQFAPPFVRAKGTGRPTKKERRSFEDYFGRQGQR